MRREPDGRCAAARAGAARRPALPLSFAQQRLWFLDQLEPGSAAYNMPVGAAAARAVWRSPPWRAALAEIVRRHEALRTTFAAVDGEPVQVIAPAGAGSAAARRPGGLADAARARPRLGAAGRRGGARPFDLARGPLLRAVAAAAGRGASTRLLLTLHHIVSDGWSMGVLVRELAALYAALRWRAGPRRCRRCRCSTPTSRSGSGAGCAGEVLEAQLGYWRERLAGAAAAAGAADRPAAAARCRAPRGAARPCALGRSCRRALRALGRREGATLFMTLLAGFQALLAPPRGQRRPGGGHADRRPRPAWRSRG